MLPAVLQNPEALASMAAPLEDEQIVALKKAVTESENHREQWLEKQRLYYRRRVSLRGTKTYPWPGCANFNMPTIDKQIRRQKPIYVRSVFGVEPMFKVVNLAGDQRRADRIQKMYPWLVLHRMRCSKIAIVHAADQMLQCGLSYVKVFWEKVVENRVLSINVKNQITEAQLAGVIPMEKDDGSPITRADIPPEMVLQVLTEELGLDPQDEHDEARIQQAMKQFREGAEVIRVLGRMVTVDAPRWKMIEAKDLIIPWDAPAELDEAPWICEIMHMSPTMMKQRARSRIWDPEVVKEILEKETRKGIVGGVPEDQAAARWVLDFERDRKEGIFGVGQQGKQNYHEIKELYFWHDFGEGVDERCILTYHARSGKTLRLIRYPYDLKTWNFVRFPFEEKEDRALSPRGIPEHLWDISTIINVQHNAWIDARTISNARTLRIRHGSPAARNPSAAMFKPGGYFYVRQPDDVTELPTQVQDFTYERLVGEARVWAETYMGVGDQSMIAAQGRVERRTATEVTAIGDIGDEIVSLDIEIWQDQMAKLHMMTLQLWAQFGPPEVNAQVDPETPALMFNRGDLANHFDVVPVGNAQNSSLRSRGQSASQILGLAGQLPGLVKRLNLGELAKDLVTGLSGFRNADRFLISEAGSTAGEAAEQINELAFMELMGTVYPVEMSDAHETHLGVGMQIMQQAQFASQQGQQPKLTQIGMQMLQGHMALHQAAMGDMTAVRELEKGGGMVFIREGTTLRLAPAPQGEGSAGGPGAQFGGAG